MINLCLTTLQNAMKPVYLHVFIDQRVFIIHNMTS